MCGRYGRRGDKQYIAEHYRVRDWEEHGIPYPYEFGANWDCRPGSIQPVVALDNGERDLMAMRWGFDLPIQGKMKTVFNTKAETVMESRLWKGRFTKNRCIVPANAFMEWKKVDGKRVPGAPKFDITVADQEMFGFAGLWGDWTNPKTKVVEKTFSIFSTEPNEMFSEYHDRQPVTLHPTEYEEWLRPPLHLLRVFPPERMVVTQVENPTPMKQPKPKKEKPTQEPAMRSLFDQMFD